MSHIVEKTQKIVQALGALGWESSLYMLLLSLTRKTEEYKIQLENDGLNTVRMLSLTSLT